MSIIFSEEHAVVVLAFRVRNRGAAYLDGKETSRIYIEKRDLTRQVEEFIEAGKLTLDPMGVRRPRLRSVEGSGGFYAAILDEPGAEEKAGDARVTGRRSPPSMHPVTIYDEERAAMRLIEADRVRDFIELLAAYRPLKYEGAAAGFDGRTIHPMTARTLASERMVYSRGRPLRGRGARTVVLLDRGASMGEPWSLWEEYTKMKAARFLADVVAASHDNAAVYGFGEALRIQRPPFDAVPADGDRRLDKAMREVSLLQPERLVVITDGEPVCIRGSDASGLCGEALDALGSLGRSGVQILVVLLGDDPEMERLYARLEDAGGALVLRLKTAGDLAHMMRGLAAWL